MLIANLVPEKTIQDYAPWRLNHKNMITILPEAVNIDCELSFVFVDTH
jgi:hypothetical protein